MRCQSAIKSKNKYEIDMTNGPILSKMLLFAIPLIFSSVLQLLFNAADIVVVGKYAGDNALSAVGSTSALINLLINVFIGLSVGANVVVARYFAAGETKKGSDAVHTSIYISIIFGIIITIGGIIFAPKILKLMNTPDEIRKLASLYLRIYFSGMTATMLYNFGSAVLRAIGDTRRPLIFLIISGFINVLLNLFFVICLKMGVAGVGIATAVSQCVSAILVLRCLMKDTGFVKLTIKKLKIHKDILIQIIKIGLPAGFQGTLFSLSNVVIQSAVNSFGDIVIAGNTIASNVEGFVYVSMNAFYQATITFVSQNIGAGKYKRINRIVITALCCVTAVGLILGLGATLLGRPLLGLYSNSQAAINAGMVRLKYICAIYFLCGIMDVMVGALRGLGRSVLPMIVSLIGACGFRLIWIYTIFQLPQFHRIETVYISYMISWLLTSATHIICYIILRRLLKKNWGV